MKKKKIALVHDFLARYGGAELVLKTFGEMYPDAPIFTLFYDEKKMGRFIPKERVKTSFLQKWFLLSGKRYTHLLPFMNYAMEQFDLSEYDVVLSSSAAFSHGVLTTADQKHVSYVHSPVRWVWDSHFSFMKQHRLSWFMKKVF